MRDERLKPCPFCGSGYDVEIDGTDNIVPYKKEMRYRCGCAGCGVWFDWLFTSEEEAIDAWNERVEPSVQISASDHATAIGVVHGGMTIQRQTAKEIYNISHVKELRT